MLTIALPAPTPACEQVCHSCRCQQLSSTAAGMRRKYHAQACDLHKPAYASNNHTACPALALVVR